ncbi:hypothetical protein G7Y79_00046g082010 [Physcia stellaris]|nr:hypothetical protein G7Y79_00046g082010 [Physcia stellaris]
MGNPNRRAVPVKPAAVAEPDVQPLPSPGPALCNGACGVNNLHEQGKTWNIGEQDLPTVIKVKHKALTEGLEHHKFHEARAARQGLVRFYSIHGAHDESAIEVLPIVPDRPKRCKNPDCLVKQLHDDKIYPADPQGLPYIVAKDLLLNFWTHHGAEDGSEFASVVPSLPEKCQDPLCPSEITAHADKVFEYGDRGLPPLVKSNAAILRKMEERHEYWVDSKAHKTNSGFFAVHLPDRHHAVRGTAPVINEGNS